jgi:hypothetical protein
MRRLRSDFSISSFASPSTIATSSPAISNPPFAIRTLSKELPRAKALG